MPSLLNYLFWDMKVDMRTLHQESGPPEVQEGHTAQRVQTAQNEHEEFGSSRHRNGGLLIEYSSLDFDRRFPAENTVEERDAHYTSAGDMT
jgi:hypothetical protein